MLTGSLIGVNEISSRDALFHLMTRHYDNMDRVKFDSDLDEKDGLIILEDEAGEVRGFSTYQLFSTVYDDRRITVLFSGDTVIERTSWGDTTLFRAFGKLLCRSMRESTDLYWFLITKGVRTYQMLPLFFRSFYPSVDAMTPVHITGLIRHLSQLKFPRHFDTESGIIRTGTYRLKEEMADIPANKRMNRHVRFFLEKNPGWRDGDELACLTELNRANMRSRALRFVVD